VQHRIMLSVPRMLSLTHGPAPSLDTSYCVVLPVRRQCEQAAALLSDGVQS
jgi:hypothetical protein